MSRTGANGANQALNVLFNLWILVEVCAQCLGEFHNLLPSRCVNAGFDAVLLLCQRCGFLKHCIRYLVRLDKRNSIELGYILDKRTKLQCIPVRNRSNRILAPHTDQLLLQSHTIGHIVIDVWIVGGIGTQESREQKTILDRINLCNPKSICHQRTSG